MPTSFLNPAQQQQFSQIPTEIAPADLIAYITLTEPDLAETSKQRLAPSRLGFAILICTMRFLVFEPEDLSTIPASVRSYVAGQLDLQVEAFSQYGLRHVPIKGR